MLPATWNLLGVEAAERAGGAPGGSWDSKGTDKAKGVAQRADAVRADAVRTAAPATEQELATAKKCLEVWWPVK